MMTDKQKEELIATLWNFLTKSEEHTDRVVLGGNYGTKTKEGLCAVIERIMKSGKDEPVIEIGNSWFEGLARAPKAITKDVKDSCIEKTVRKLRAEGVRTWEYDRQKALKILGRCVAPVVMQNALALWESEVLDAMKVLEAGSNER